MIDSAGAESRLSIDDLRETVPFPSWKPVLTVGQRRLLCWNDKTIGFAAFYHGEQPGDAVCAWFWERGWLPYAFEGTDGKSALVAPIVFVDTPDVCFHTTPREHAAAILNGDLGLVSSRKAKRTTTGRPEASRYIHVSLNDKDARAWAEQDRLLRDKWPGVEWSIIEIGTGQAGRRLFRDPVSATGYIIDGECVDRGHLKLHSEFSIGR